MGFDCVLPNWSVFLYKEKRLCFVNTLDKPTVTIIGTCRVHDTLRQVENKGLININNGGLQTYVHSLPEIFFRLKVLKRQSKYSAKIMDLQVDTRSGTETKPSDEFSFSDSEVIVIEISSLKSIFYETHPLQYNEVNRHLCSQHGEYGIELRANINYAFNNNQSSIITPKSPYPDTLSESHRQIISNLRPKLMSEEDIYSYLNKICEYIKKPVLFVNHINVEGENGRKITSRNRLCKIIDKYCFVNGFALFEPAGLFQTYNKKDLLAKDGEDLAHYAKTALETVGLAQYNRIIKIIHKNSLSG